jgi:pyruvate dehydrogenase E2 component (dihydrolipoamide acetyltransferase)
MPFNFQKCIKVQIIILYLYLYIQVDQTLAMATTVILPKQGQSVETCIITEWYKKKGDKVAVGDLLFSYETDKASFEEEAAVEGVLLDVFYKDGDEVPVLAEVAVIGEPGEAVERPIAFGTDAKSGAAPFAESATTPEPAAPSLEASAATALVSEHGSAPAQSGGRIRISPRARRMAADNGIMIENMTGSGPNGRIIVRDVEALIGKEATVETARVSAAPEAAPAASMAPAAPAAAPAKPSAQAVKTTPAMAYTDDSETRPLSNIRKLISKAMHDSLQNSAQLTHHLSADARKILSLRSKVKKIQAEGYEYNITLNDMVAYAVIRALKKHPDANVHFLGDSIQYFRKVHLGMAVDTERGLMVPALKNADDLSLPGLSSQLSQLASACRGGSVDPDLLQPTAASFTISNLGAYGVEMFTPVINLPQAAILGVNTIIQRPAQLEGGAFGFVPYMGLSLTYDHRALDGGPATLFLAEIKKEIENFDHDLIKR